MTFYDLFRLPLAMIPDRGIVSDAGSTVDYLTLDARARELSAGLARLGAGKGTRIAVLQTNDLAWVELYLASALLGATLVGVNYRAKSPEIAHMLESSRSEIVFAGARYWPLLQAVRADLHNVQTYVLVDSDVSGDVSYDELFGRQIGTPESGAGGDTSLILFTSGTTALPKTVEMSHDQLCAYVRQMADLPDLLAAPESTLLCAPLYHVAGFTSLLIGLYSGRRLVLIPQFEPHAWLDAVERDGVTSAFVVPTMLKQILNCPAFAQRDLSSLERISYGAAPMPVRVIREAIERLPHVSFNNAYGQTETISTVTVLGPEDHRLSGSTELVEARLRRLASVGRPLPGIGLRIVGEEDAPLAAGLVGEVCIEAPDRLGPSGVDPDAAEDGSESSWVRTGDLGYLDDDGYLFLTGRKSDLIIRGGENIAPREVEAVLERHDDVEGVAVVGVPDEQWGESVAAFVVRRSASTLGEHDVNEFARERLASYKKPTLVFFVDELPLTSTGKVSRRLLREQAATMAAGL
jgi:acyl-CoA synthetase (AMP-forming)/AMP-acid ligase II